MLYLVGGLSGVSGVNIAGNIYIIITDSCSSSGN